MAAFLRTKTTHFVSIKDGNGEDYLNVVNPVYEEIKVKVKVKFSKGADEAFFKKQLIEDLKYFIAPWAKDKTQAISFSRALSQADFIQFLESRPFIDYIKDLNLFLSGTVVNSILSPSTSHSILTTSSNHSITIIPKN